MALVNEGQMTFREAPQFRLSASKATLLPRNILERMLLLLTCD